MLFDIYWEDKTIQITHNEAIVLDQCLTMSSFSQDYLDWLMTKDLLELRHQACEIFSELSAEQTKTKPLLITSETVLKLLLCIIPTTIMIGPDPAGYTLKCKLTKAAKENIKEEHKPSIDIDKLMSK